MTRLRTLLERGPADQQTVVCVDRTHALIWGDLGRCRDAFVRVLLDSPAAEPVVSASDPFDFLAALLACWHVGRTAIIPPNFQPGTVARFSRDGRLVLATRPSADDASCVRSVTAPRSVNLTALPSRFTST